MWRNLVRNALSNAGGTLVGLVVGFVTMPLSSTTWGWRSSPLGGRPASSAISASSTSARRRSNEPQPFARDEPGTRRGWRDGQHDRCVYVVLGTLGGLALAFVGVLAPALFRVPPDDLATFRTVLCVVGLQTALGLPMSIWNGLLSGVQAFPLLNAIGVTTTLVRGALTVSLVLTGHGLVALVTASFGVTLGAWAVACLAAHRRIPGLRVRPSGFRAARLREIGRFSLAMVVWSVAGAVLHQLDRVLIGVVMPVAALTTYEVGARLSSYSRTVLHSWLSIAKPATAAIAARGERGRLQPLPAQHALAPTFTAASRSCSSAPARRS
jgi:O-antigen/teichoic acid export membrane protein